MTAFLVCLIRIIEVIIRVSLIDSLHLNNGFRSRNSALRCFVRGKTEGRKELTLKIFAPILLDLSGESEFAP